MGIFKDILSEMFGERYNTCIFCQSKFGYKSPYCGKHIGICRECMEKIKFTPHHHVFETRPPIEYLISPMQYSTNIRRELLDFKFKDRHAYAEIFARIMYETCADAIPNVDMVIPIPVSEKRFAERGYNQAELLAEKISEFIGKEYIYEAAVKERDTKRQMNMPMYERHINLGNPFKVSDIVCGKNILIVDDIYTTGSTMHTFALALKEKSAQKIFGISAAVSDMRVQEQKLKEREISTLVSILKSAGANNKSD